MICLLLGQLFATDLSPVELKQKDSGFYSRFRSAVASYILPTAVAAGCVTLLWTKLDPFQEPSVDNCTYYYQYLAENSTALNILENTTCPTESLSLDGQKIGSFGAAAIVPALYQLTPWSVSLGLTQLGDTGLIILGPVLQHFGNSADVAWLDLDSNKYWS